MSLWQTEFTAGYRRIKPAKDSHFLARESAEIASNIRAEHYLLRPLCFVSLETTVGGFRGMGFMGGRGFMIPMILIVRLTEWPGKQRSFMQCVAFQKSHEDTA